MPPKFRFYMPALMLSDLHFTKTILFAFHVFFALEDLLISVLDSESIM